MSIKSTAATVLSRIELQHGYHELTVGPIEGLSKCRPGQFVHLQLLHRDVYLRRAMSIAQVDSKKKSLQIIFKTFGKGTSLLGGFDKGDEIGVLGPLGNHFSAPKKNTTPIYLAGGVGLPPLLYHAEESIAKGFPKKQIHFFYGGRTEHDIIERSRLKKLGVQVHIMTDDGSHGEKGVVTEGLTRLLKSQPVAHPYLYGCGPDGMLRATNALALAQNIPGELSLEAPMPCGVGMCLGCVVNLTAGGHARVCVEGPIFRIGEVKL